MRARDSLPVVDPTDLAADETRPDAAVHGVVLAAGTSSRFGGRNKLLEPVGGEPMVVRAVRTLLEADLDGVTVVVGFEADRVRTALADLAVSVVENPQFERGQSTSVACGVEQAASRGADAVVLALGDMPEVSVAAVDALIAVYRRGATDAIAAAYEGERGNPVLFADRYFDDLVAVDGDVGGRRILLESPDAVAVETGDPGVLFDVDERNDL